MYNYIIYWSYYRHYILSKRVPEKHLLLFYWLYQSLLQSMRSQSIGHDWVTELSWTEHIYGLQGGASGKEPACQCRRHGTRVQFLGQEDHKGGHGSPPHYSCLENPRDRAVWWATVCRVAKGWTWLKWHSMYTLPIIKWKGTQPFSHHYQIFWRLFKNIVLNYILSEKRICYKRIYKVQI